jgi:hypothetical protein
MLVICFQSKLKKIQEKYGDQDEEERQLRLELLAVSFSLHFNIIVFFSIFTSLLLIYGFI